MSSYETKQNIENFHYEKEANSKESSALIFKYSLLLTQLIIKQK